ncbi:MAG: hypothetical protein WBA45_08280 [Microthrixaceae bacterium]
MASNQISLRAPDLVNPHGIISMLASTDVAVESCVARLLDELAVLAECRDTHHVASVFLDPGHGKGHLRWAAFLAAHLHDGSAPESLHRPPWTIPNGMRSRPLARVEQAICRVTVSRWDQRCELTPAQYVIAERSAMSGELIRIPITAAHVSSVGKVHLGGGRDQLPRTVELDDWGTRILIRRLNEVNGRDRSTPLLYDGNDPGTNNAQASASGNLKRVLRIAGLGSDPTLTPTSIRNTYAQRLYENGERLENIAEAMGAKSLDRLLRTIDTTSTKAVVRDCFDSNGGN